MPERIHSEPRAENTPTAAISLEELLKNIENVSENQPRALRVKIITEGIAYTTPEFPLWYTECTITNKDGIIECKLHHNRRQSNNEWTKTKPWKLSLASFQKEYGDGKSTFVVLDEDTPDQKGLELPPATNTGVSPGDTTATSEISRPLSLGSSPAVRTETLDSAREYFTAAQHYLENLEKTRDMRHIVNWWRSLRLTERLSALETGASETKLAAGFVLQQLRQSSKLRPDVQTITMEKTLVIQFIPHQRDILTGPATVVPLGEEKIRVIATVLYILRDLTKDPEFLSALEEKGIERITFTLRSWRERGGEKYDITVPIFETEVTSSQ